MLRLGFRAYWWSFRHDITERHQDTTPFPRDSWKETGADGNRKNTGATIENGEKGEKSGEGIMKKEVARDTAAVGINLG